jgi:RHS repeat-associated protein
MNWRTGRKSRVGADSPRSTAVSQTSADALSPTLLAAAQRSVLALSSALGYVLRNRTITPTVVAALIAVSMAMASAPAPASAALPKIETEHMPQIVEWVYRNGADESPLPCSSTCASLWTAEHSEVPLNHAGQELWNELGELEMSGTGLWASFDQLRKSVGVVFLGEAPLQLGWRINAGHPTGHDIWLKIAGPREPGERLGAPPECPGKAWPTWLKDAGEEVGPSFIDPAIAPDRAWFLMQCGGGSGGAVVQQVKEKANPEGSACGEYGPPPSFGWKQQQWLWNQCYEGSYMGHEALSKTYAFAYREPFDLSVPQDFTGQHLEGEATHNTETNTAHDPGVPAVIEATEAALEKSPDLRIWLAWLLEGSGENPLRSLAAEGFGSGNPGAPDRHECYAGKPVNCATGNETITQTDLTVRGRGPGLQMARSYNSQLAVSQASPGLFGYGWTDSYSANLEINTELGMAIVHQDNGSDVRFLKEGGQWRAGGALVQATLRQEGSAYVYTLPDQTVLNFDSTGHLTSEVDRNGNALSMTRGGSGRLESVSDQAGRKLTFTYNAEGLLESAKDPMGHVVKYAYEGGNLTSVIEPGEASPRWQFKYDGSHELTTETDGRGHAVTSEYDGAHRVIAQTDALSRTHKWEYAGTEASGETTISEPNGSTTVELFNDLGMPTSVTRASGTAASATTLYAYDSDYELVSVTDPDKNVVLYAYDGSGNRVGETNALGDSRLWTYNATHDVLTTTMPSGETTTIKRDAHGNAESISRPAPGGTTQTTNYKYDVHGQLESVEDPLKRVWKYEYDANGDRTAEIDPEADKRTWGYNEDSRETSMVSPNGHVAGAKEVKFTTTIERDAQGRVIKVTAPLKHETKYAYDHNGNLESVTDPELNKTSYTYDADDEPIKVEASNKTITETGYDGAGRVTSQTDGNKHTTTYVRNALEEVVEVVDPLSRKTSKEYDSAGNLTHMIDAATRTTTYKYDPGNRLTEVSYSDGVTPTAKYEYDADGDRTQMIDGTGTSKYTYDQLDRLTEAKDGHGNVSSYEYDLANEQTKTTYPNGKAVTRAFDNAGRLKSVTDWLEHTTKFGYDANSNQTSMTFPSGTSNEDTNAYNEADAMSEVKMAKGAEALASILYTRNKDNGVTKATTKGLPGEEKPAFAYDENSRLSKGAGTTYKYDAADNPMTIGSETYSYDAASELEKGVLKKATVNTYSYDEVGERTQSKPASGPAAKYGYDQAGNLITVTRAHEGEVPAIEDSYAYDGTGLRALETVSGTAHYLAWDLSEGLPLILNDGANSYVYGPGGLPVEQISGEGSAVYLHHDQQGSTRMLTGSAGTVAGTTTYDGYGNRTGGTGSSTTPLGYDGQYTSTDTGLIYLRNRVYDPSTAQFLTVDPVVSLTRAPYTYALDNPVNYADSSGLEAIPLPTPVVGGCAAAPEVCGGVVVGGVDVWLGAKVFNAWAGEEGGNDEGEAELRTKEVERESEEPCGEGPPRSLPHRGEPNSSAALDRGNGTGQIREYGPDGLPTRDFDFGHDHGFGDPHAHDWVEGLRGPGRPIEPNE